jgi:hypothetical protein
MFKSCIVCSAVASPGVLIQYCDQCMSAMYCSEACQKKDWKTRHKKICKFLNVGHGDMQLRTEAHTEKSNVLKELFETGKRSLDEDMKGFFKLFEESTFGGSQAAARKMKKIARRQTKHDKIFLLQHSLDFLVRTSNSEMLSWPNSPLLVMLQFVDPNIMSVDEHGFLQEGQATKTPLHQLAHVADPFDYSTHVNQIILAKQLIKHGADVNTVSSPGGETPLYFACLSHNVTNLEFVELLLSAGANPNTVNRLGVTPLMRTTKYAPGAAKLLLKWHTTDVTIISRSGESFPISVRRTIKYFSDKIALADNPDRIQHQSLLQQWREIDSMVVEEVWV